MGGSLQRVGDVQGQCISQDAGLSRRGWGIKGPGPPRGHPAFILGHARPNAFDGHSSRPAGFTTRADVAEVKSEKQGSEGLPALDQMVLNWLGAAVGLVGTWSWRAEPWGGIPARGLGPARDSGQARQAGSEQLRPRETFHPEWVHHCLVDVGSPRGTAGGQMGPHCQSWSLGRSFHVFLPWVWGRRCFRLASGRDPSLQAPF